MKIDGISVLRCPICLDEAKDDGRDTSTFKVKKIKVSLEQVVEYMKANPGKKSAEVVTATRCSPPLVTKARRILESKMI